MKRARVKFIKLTKFEENTGHKIVSHGQHAACVFETAGLIQIESDYNQLEADKVQTKCQKFGIRENTRMYQ